MSQLCMEKTNLAEVPRIPVPEGYVLRTYQPGDEAGIARVYEASRLGGFTAETVRERMLSHPSFKPERLFVVEHEGELVGTAAAWTDASGPDRGYLHMVGLLGEHRGKKLGALLTIAAILRNRDEGFTVQRLHTDDWREAAIRLYLGLGYYPLYTGDDHPERWRVLAEKLNRREAVARARDARH